MNNEKPLIIYAMVGPMGSGKTTFALRLSQKKNARFFSLDQTIKELGHPIRDLNDYETHMAKALEIIGTNAKSALAQNVPVAFDFGGGIGHWNWLKEIADSANAFVEIYQFEIPIETRLERVRKRNQEKPGGIYHFTMSDDEVMASKPTRETPTPNDRVKIIKVSH